MQKDSERLFKIFLEASQHFLDDGICKFSELIPSIHSSQKLFSARKENRYEPLEDISLRSVGFRESIYIIPCF